MSSALALAWLLPAFLFLALLQATGPAGEQSGLSLHQAQPVKKDVKATLAKLKKQADKASAELSTATKRYEKNKSTVKLAKARLQRTRVAAARADQVYEKYRSRVGSFAGSAYQAPLPDQNSVLLTSPDGKSAVQKATSLHIMTKGEQAAVEQANTEKQRADAFNRQAEKLASKATSLQQKLATELKELRKKSAASTRKLTRLLNRLAGGAASRYASRAVLDARCGKAGDYSSQQFSNGLVPDWALCELPGYPGERLRGDAARGFVDANAAFYDAFGKKLCITDSYRSLQEQQSVYATKPGLAAVPGTSNHGEGLALDLCGGVNRFGTAEHNWLAANGPRYGWVHPDWAKCCPAEAWHFEYEPGTG